MINALIAVLFLSEQKKKKEGIRGIRTPDFKLNCLANLAITAY